MHAVFHSKGVSLVELMVAVAIVAILAALAVPAMGSWVRNNRVEAVASEFYSSLSSARVEAVSRRAVVRVTAISPGSSNNEWGGGWLVWVDTNGDASHDPGEELSVHDAVPSTVTLDSVANISDISFQATGRSTAATTQFWAQGESCTGSNAQSVDVGPTGRISKAVQSCR